MKKLIILFVLILFIGRVSAIKITEIEMNPIEGKNGIEWIELYNDGSSEKDISNWEIWEGVYGLSGPKIITAIPNGTIIQNNEFYIVEWGGSKLNNDGDFVILYNSSGNKIDETETRKESSSSTKTWQLCNSEWIFKESTKGEKNDCEKTPEKPEELNEAEEEEEEENEEEIEIEETQEPEPIYYEETDKEEEVKLEIIKLKPLNSKDIKTEDNNEESNKNTYAKYGFVVFCILLGFLFILKKRKNYKTEFEENENKEE